MSDRSTSAVESGAAPSSPRILRGSCLCGDVGYRITAPPLRMVNCHCTNCRRARSAAYATNLLVPAKYFRWTRGETQVASYSLPHSPSVSTAFCRRCGSDLPRPAQGEATVIVPAGTLDGDPNIRAEAHVCVSEKAPWYEITDTLPQHPDTPSTA